MRRMLALVVCVLGALLAACGEADETSLPKAATDTTVSPAKPAADPADPAEPGAGAGVLRGSYKRLNGDRVDLARYDGRVVLVVNTATECGYTPQFEGLEALYRKRRGDGLVVFGFPANDFAGQEPRSDEEIATFCEANYGVSFPMFARTQVAGGSASALYRTLADAAGAPEWNFNKYLVDRRGRVVARYGAGTEPDAPELTERIDELLAAAA